MDATIQLPVGKLLVQNIVLVFIPFILGIIFRIKYVTLSGKIAAVLRKISFPALVLLASVFFIYPAILVLNALAFNCVSIWVISLLVDIYILFLFYNISLYCMRGKRGSVLLVIAILAMFMFTVYATNYRIGWFMLKNAAATLACLV
jgi:hypothetical protein